MPTEPPDSPAEPVDPPFDPPSGRDGSEGIDLARAALAEARGRARERAPRAGSRRAAAQHREKRSRGADPLPFAAAVEALVTERGWQLPAAVGGVMDRWAEVVGPEIAGHATPEAFEAGVLRVRAGSTAWATQLRLLAPDIVRRLNVELGHGSVTRLDIRGPGGPSWRRGPLRVSDGRGPRDTYG